MKTNKPITMKTKHALSGLISGLLFLGAVVDSHAGLITLDFDSVPVPTAGGVDATGYLLSYGIGLSGNFPVSIFTDQNFYGSTTVKASSGHNFLLQQVSGSPNGVTFTMHFSAPLTSLSFDSIAIIAPSAIGWWTATAFNAASAAVATTGQVFPPATSSGVHYSLFDANFMTDGGITALTITADGHNSAGISSVPLDNLTLSSVPEPGTALFGIACVGVAALRRRRRA